MRVGNRTHGPRGRLTAVGLAGALALLLLGLTATGAGAASLQTICGTTGDAGATTAGSAASPAAGSAQATTDRGGTTESTPATACPGEPAVGVQVAGGAPSCTLALPKGAAPGAVVIVTLPSDGATSCSIAVANPVGAAGPGVAVNQADGASCTQLMPAGEAPAPPVAATGSAPDNQAVIATVPGEVTVCTNLEIPANGGTVCAAVVNGAPAGTAGAAGKPDQVTAAPAAIDANGDMACPPPANAGFELPDLEVGDSITCTFTRGQDGGSVTCATQP